MQRIEVNLDRDARHALQVILYEIDGDRKTDHLVQILQAKPDLWELVYKDGGVCINLGWENNTKNPKKGQYSLLTPVNSFLNKNVCKENPDLYMDEKYKAKQREDILKFC